MDFEDLDLGRFSDKIQKSKLTLNKDGSYDYDGDLIFSSMGLKSFDEIPIRFRKVVGIFTCYDNQLTSLKYGPSYVGGDFWCCRNYLTSLQYAPLEVGGSFYCYYNYLISLQYGPLKIAGYFDVGNNLLLSKAHKSEINGTFTFDHNPFEIKNEAIKVVKEMTIEQRIAELKFFEEHDQDAYEMMIKILEENDLGYGPKAKEMLELTESYDISNLV